MKLISSESTHCVEVDDVAGTPVRLSVDHPRGTHGVQFHCTVEVEVGGSERRGATGGLEYADTVRLSDPTVTGRTRVQETPCGTTWRVPISVGGVTCEVLYRFNRLGPALSLGFDFVGEQTVVVRNVVLRGEIGFEAGDWTVTAPGNGMASGLSLEHLIAPVGISPVGGLRGSSGLVHLESNGHAPATALWFDSDVEVPEIEICAVSPRSLSFVMTTNFAADLEHTSSNELQLLSIDVAVPRWPEFPGVFAGWLRTRGLTSPAAPPAWVLEAMIYEAQIGFSVFAGVHRYSPYPELVDLANDLERIQSLGFTVIQLMPRQPYPSYNVHDYWDVDASYGERAVLVELIARCHAKGIHIILDVLLHGVLDQESIGAAADGVRAGPFAELVSAETGDSFSSDVNDWTNYLIAWSRHILDFEPYWRAGSVAVSPLTVSNPGWFARDSAGQITGVYTKAFDARSRDWQLYFTDAMAFLMTDLSIDGFRFDAPTYNDFPNWAEWARARAGSSMLSCVGLFERLRPVLKGIKADSLLYTEPSGHALRRSMDLNYNYDEQWLVTAIANAATAKPWGVRNAKDLATWMRDRDALLPAGSITAHHIDSHDTFWWPSWGRKWRREQFSMEQFRLLTLIFACLPGPFMMFTGGEVGIEDVLPRLAELKAQPLWQRGRVLWWCADDIPDSVFGVTRTIGDDAVSVIANFADTATSFRLSEAMVRAAAAPMYTLGPPATLGSDQVSLRPYSAIVFMHRAAPAHVL